MRHTIIILLALTTPALAADATATSRVTRSVGSRWLGAEVVERVDARTTGERCEVVTTTEARVRLLTTSLPAFRLEDRRAGEDLARRPVLRRGTKVTLLGQVNLTVTRALFKRSFKLASVNLPVVTLGPFPVTLVAELGAYLSVKEKGAFDWRDGPRASTSVEAEARLGGTLRLGPGIPGIAQAGVKGELDLLKLRAPATVVLRVDGLALDAKLVLESRAAVRLFAKVGLGFLKKELAVGVPSLSWHLLKVEVPVLHEELRVRSL